MFEDTSSHKSEIWVPTNTTERSKGIFSENHAKKLIYLFQDMIEGVPISKPAILKRLANKELELYGSLNRKQAQVWAKA